MTHTNAFFHFPTTGWLQISGADRVDFLQRQSTNDITLLTAEHVITTVLTNAAARILDVLQLVSMGDVTLGAIPLPGRAAATAHFLKRRIFFMDKVTVTDSSAEIVMLDLVGAGAADILQGYGVTPPGLDALAHGEIQGIPVRVLGQRGLLGDGYRLLAESNFRDQLAAAAGSAGAKSLSEDEVEVLRVEAGLPGPLRELTEDYTPLEMRLEHLISDKKGCYTGQEVIARQITYDKITKSLAGLRLAAPVNPGDRVFVEDAAVGEVTSAVHSPRFGTLALAVIKRPHFERGMVVEVQGVRGQVTNLPFID